MSGNQSSGKVSHPGSAMVKVEEKDGTVIEEKHISFAVELTTMFPTKVVFGLHRTIGLPNYDSAKVNIGIEVYCDPSTVDETLQKAAAWCEARLKAKVDPILESRKPRRERAKKDT